MAKRPLPKLTVDYCTLKDWIDANPQDAEWRSLSLSTRLLCLLLLHEMKKYRYRKCGGRYLTEAEHEEMTDWVDAAIFEITHPYPPPGPADFECIEYETKSPNVSYFPNNPHSQPDFEYDWPLPFINVRWMSYTGLLLLFSNFLGVQEGDVFAAAYLNLTPPTEPPELPSTGFPSITFYLQGEGELEIQFLTVPYGGLAVINIDDGPWWQDYVKNLATDPIEFIDLGVDDWVNLDPERITITGDTTHKVTVQFVPNATLEPPWLLFGGGVRKILWCGDAIQGVVPVPDIRVNNCVIEVSWNGIDWSVVSGDYDLCPEDGITPQLRLDPEDNCKLEISYDAGETWDDITGDYSLCGEQGEPGPTGPQGPQGEPGNPRYLRVLDCVLQISDDGLQWVDVVDLGACADDPEQTIPDPEGGVPDARCAVAEGFANSTLDALVAALESRRDAGSLAAAIAGIATAFVTPTPAVFVGAFLTAFLAWEASTAQDALDDIDAQYREDVSCLAYEYLNDNDQDSITSAMLDYMATEVLGLTTNADHFYSDMLPTFSLELLRLEAQLWALDPTASCAECQGYDWCEIFDFTVDDGGWHQTTAGRYGQYSAGEGWIATCFNEGDKDRKAVRVVVDFPEASTINYVQAWFTAYPGTYNPVGDGDGSLYDTVGALWSYESPVPTGTQTRIWEGTHAAVDYVGLHLWTSIGSCTGNATITKVMICGTGNNPFEA